MPTPDQARAGVGDTVQLRATKGQAPKPKPPCGAFLAQDRSSLGTCGVPSPPGRHSAAGLLQLDLSSEPTRIGKQYGQIPPVHPRPTELGIQAGPGLRGRTGRPGLGSTPTLTGSGVGWHWGPWWIHPYHRLYRSKKVSEPQRGGQLPLTFTGVHPAQGPGGSPQSSLLSSPTLGFRTKNYKAGCLPGAQGKELDTLPCWVETLVTRAASGTAGRACFSSWPCGLRGPCEW